jgi:hypothetical protein
MKGKELKNKNFKDIKYYILSLSYILNELYFIF